MTVQELILSAVRCGILEAESNVAPRLMELKEHPESTRLWLFGITMRTKLHLEDKLKVEEERFNHLLNKFLGLRELIGCWRNYVRATRETHLYRVIYMVTRETCDLGNFRQAEQKMLQAEADFVNASQSASIL